MTLKVLIADDSNLIRNIYKDKLSKNGHTAVLTDDGYSCLKTYSEQCDLSSNSVDDNFDAVLLDYNLPDIKGSDIAKKILEKNPLQKIIVISDSNTGRLKEAFKEVKNHVEILQKGFPIDALITKLEDDEEK